MPADKSIKVLGIAAVFMVGIGLANIDVNVKQTTVKPNVTRTVERTKTVVKHDGTKKPSGYISNDDCHQIAKGTDFSDLIFRYGWPADDDGDDSYAGRLLYPLSEDHDSSCYVSFYRGEVEEVTVFEKAT